LEAEVVEKRLEIKKLEAEVTKKERLHVSTHSPRPTKSSRVGRNDSCPCGSGKKFKNCCIKKHVG
jgi:preprotein translocase subunit SecA